MRLQKQRILYENQVHFIQCKAYLRPFMHAIVALMSALFKNSKTFSYFLYAFVPFWPFSALSCPFLINLTLLFMSYNMHCSHIITYTFCIIQLFTFICTINCILRSRSNKAPFPSGSEYLLVKFVFTCTECDCLECF